MSFPRYPAYKDSGVEWLGEVPAHWQVARFSRVIAAIKDGTHGTFERVAEGRPLLSAKNVLNGHLDIGDAESLISDSDHAEIVANGFPRIGDLLLTIVGTIGRACVYKEAEPLAFQRSVCFIRLRKEIEPRLFYYFSQSKFFQEQLIGKSKSSAQAGVYMGDVASTSVLFPHDPKEQTAIVNFLDRETAKIDALVAEQEKLIALLQEKRQAVISHAVTKGLDPNMPMKDSGVDWLGAVPGHWEVKRIKHLVASLEQGWSPQCEGFPVQSDDEWGILKVGCVNGGVFRPEENKTLPPELEPVPALGLAAGDLLISRANTRELVGGAAVALKDYPKLMLCDKLYRLRFQPNVCEPTFLALYLGTPQIRGQIELAATGASSSMLNIGQSTILELDVAVPPVDEQRRILNVVSDQMARADTLTTEARTAITLLQERRTALISAAVTGQIDVRGLASAFNATDSIAACAYPVSAGG